jgi:DNA-binding NarL/FixJ family response regulator
MATAALIDDHTIFRDVVKILFELNGGPKVVGEASFPEAAGDIVQATRPDLVLLDVSFPSGHDGIPLARELIRHDPAQRIIFVTMVKEAASVAEALSTGALGYVTKDQTYGDLSQAIGEAMAGRRYVAPTLQAHDDPRSNPLALLTRREREVFDLVIEGISTQGTADRLHISPRTVETHRSRIMVKFGVHSATELIRIAARLGLIK